MNSNLQYGTSKHLESLRKMLHFKFSWKKYKTGDICVVIHSNLEYGTSKVCMWNSTFQVFVKKLKNWEHLGCRELQFAIWYIKTVWKFTWNVIFQVFLKNIWKNNYSINFSSGFYCKITNLSSLTFIKIIISHCLN